MRSVKASPPPVNETICGEPEALSAIVIVPVRVPPAVGVNVTERAQFAPTATLVPQFCVTAKSPDAVMEVSPSAALPVLLNVTVCAALLGSQRLVGEGKTR